MDLQIAPEGIEVANAYLTYGSMEEAANQLCLPLEKVEAVLNRADVKRYIDNIYLDKGYRNRHKLGALMDKIIESKLEECNASEVYSSKDIVDILQIAHKMRMEEIKALTTNVKNQTNIQVNEAPFGGGNYGELMKKLLG